MKNKIPVILIFGPTAVGKTDLLVKLNKLFKKNIEIINSDSIQIYRFLDIGSAKPDEDTLKSIKHHLINIKNPDEAFNVADFVFFADDAVHEIHKRSNMAVISGGTGFYLKNFVNGLPEAPPSDEKVRTELMNELETSGIEALYDELKEKDPVSYSRININDHYRIVRALEVCRSTGNALSSYKIPDKERSEYNFLLIGLERPRKELYERINLRVDLMFEQGLYQEYLALKGKGYNKSSPGMKAIGYQEFFLYENKENENIETIKELIKRNSRRYAKRQICFFKSLENVKWFDAEKTDEIIIEIKSFTDKI